MNQLSSHVTTRLFKLLLTLTALSISHQALALVTAGNDSATTSADNFVQIQVLENDFVTDNDGESQVVATNPFVAGSVFICLPGDSTSECERNEVSVTLTAPSNGFLTLGNDGVSIIYTPDSGFEGPSDSFTYATYQNGDGEIVPSDVDTATVTISFGSDSSSSEQSEEEQQLEEAVNSLCDGTEDSSLSESCSALDDLSDEERVDALSTISADQVTAEFTTTVSMIREQNSNLLSRLTQLRQGASGFNITNLQLDTESGVLGGRWLQAAYDTTTSGGPQSGGSAGSESAAAASPFGLFINGSISTGDKDSNQDERGYDLDGNNFTLGLDYRFSESIVAGVAYGISDTEIEFNSTGDSMDNSSNYVFFYGSWFSNNFHLDSTIGFASGEIDTERKIFTDETIKGSTDADQISLQISGSYDFTAGALNYGPYARIDLIDGKIDAYEETGSSGFEVGFDKQDIQSRLLTAGGQAQYVLSYDWGVLIPSARFEMKKEFEDEQDAITGRFLLDANNTTFSITADEIDDFWFQSGVGVTTVLPYGFSAYVDYETMFGLDSLTLDTYSFGGRWELEF